MDVKTLEGVHCCVSYIVGPKQTGYGTTAVGWIDFALWARLMLSPHVRAYSSTGTASDGCCFVFCCLPFFDVFFNAVSFAALP